jgi:hypothetical protein
MTAHVAEKMSGVRESLGKIRRARCLMSSGRIRKRIFERAKSCSDDLFSETMKVAPTYMREAEEGRWVVNRLGGLEEISKSARSVQSIIPQVSCALETDVAAINFEELERKDRKHRIFRKISNILHYASYVAVGIGAFISLAIPKITGTQLDGRLYNAGSYIAFGGMSSVFLTSVALETIEYLRPGIKRIRKAIDNMREGLEELGQSLQELLDTTSTFHK